MFDHSHKPRNAGRRADSHNELFNRLNHLLVDLRVAARSEQDNKTLVIETFNLLTKEIGYSQDVAGRIIYSETRARRRGRRATWRQIYLEAFTLMLESKNMTLGKVIKKLYEAIRLCDCQKTHADYCLQRFNSTTRETRQAFQTGIREIKKRLQQHEAGRMLVEQYDSLHPNRQHRESKKSMEK